MIGPPSPPLGLDGPTRHLDPPFALVDLDAFDANAADMEARAGGVPIRLASKSVRCVDLIRRALARPGFAGVLAFTLPEALWLHAQGVSDDILVAYPTADRGALTRLAAEPAVAAAIALTVDDPEQLDLLDAVRDGRELQVCIELDASWRPRGRVHVGARRSPLHAPEQAVALARDVARRPGLELAGLMVYDAQVAGVGDRPPGRPLRGAAVAAMQRASLAELAERRAAAVAAVEEVAPLRFVNAGGTGSLDRVAPAPEVTELSAGSGLLGPALFDAYRGFRPRPAALFALPVVRRPAADIVTVLGGGYVASGPPGRDRLPSVHAPEGLRMLRSEGAGEVQTPLRGRAARSLRIGDRVWMRHAKAGELCERFDVLHLLSGARLIGAAPTYRGQGQAFL
jgi:D-serine deaminase-like pyridoxal phosphate-dependent protein